jgi:transforming growth factor-beta-induced protein
MVSRLNKCVRFAAIATVTAGLGMAACTMNNDPGVSMSGPELSKPDKDIVQIATGDNMGDVSTLVKALVAADLVDTLKGPGPFTVFAPTNEAFNALPAGTLDDLLKPENKDKLRTILLYHVHTGEGILASQIHTMSLSTADAGKSLAISVNGDTVMVNDAKVVKTDIVAKNGVIHWIDKVVMPPMN